MSTNLQVGKEVVYSSGFHILDSLETGSVITVRRNGKNIYNGKEYRLT